MNVADFTLAEQVLVVLFVLFGSVSVGLVLENNPLAIYLEWIKYALIMITLIIYPLPVWLEWTLGLSILFNGLFLLFKKKDIINTSESMIKALN
jgi:integral membrane sensor domain MASE1